MKELTTILIDHEIDIVELFGNMDKNLNIIKEYFEVEIIQRDNKLIIEGKDKDKAKSIIIELMEVLKSNEKIDAQKIHYIVNLRENGFSYKKFNINKETLGYTHMGKPIMPKTIGQKFYVQAINNKDVVFGIGPAGTGKTYIAVAMAVSAYKRKSVKKIILTRPAVEAGENLGFLPGDLQDKVDPYLKPIYDALYDVLGRENANRLKEKEVIEIVPLAYMRGRTLDNAFIILDEAQNTSPKQMQMFLTRMGFGSKMVINGDISQIDLPKGKKSGLVEVTKVLEHVKDIKFCYLKDVDVVRHELVKKIIVAYDKYHDKDMD